MSRAFDTGDRQYLRVQRVTLPSSNTNSSKAASSFVNSDNLLVPDSTAAHNATVDDNRAAAQSQSDANDSIAMAVLVGCLLIGGGLVVSVAANPGKSAAEQRIREWRRW